MIKNLLLITITTLTLLSCEPKIPLDTKPIPKCAFDAKRQVVLYDLKLNDPNGMSFYYSNIAFPTNATKGLYTVLETKGNYDSNKTNSLISVKILADGKDCKGEEGYEYRKGNQDVHFNSITNVLYPSNGDGETTIDIRTDDFYEDETGRGYNVTWSTSGNNPNGGLKENLTGKKNTHTASKVFSSYIYKNGERTN